jgi:hypothetical protein
MTDVRGQSTYVLRQPVCRAEVREGLQWCEQHPEVGNDSCQLPARRCPRCRLPDGMGQIAQQCLVHRPVIGRPGDDCLRDCWVTGWPHGVVLRLVCSLARRMTLARS